MNSQSTCGKRKSSSSTTVTTQTGNLVSPSGEKLGTYITQSYDVKSSKKSRSNK
jgi:hypothetical protein